MSRLGRDLLRLPGALVLVLAPSIALSRPATAQDTHYWTLQSGARATLLGGTGAVLEPELSASFYNPGSLASVSEDNALSMFVKTTTRVGVSFGDSPNVQARSDLGSSTPGFFGVRLPLHLVDGDVITFSYLMRQASELDLSGTGLTATTVPTRAVDLFIYQDVTDGWYGLSWAREAKGLGLGISLFYSSVTYRQRVQNRLVDLTGVIDGVLESDDLEVQIAARRLIAKAGATWSAGPVTLGAALTLPSVRLPLSDGRVSVGRALLSTDADPPLELAQDRQEKVRANYRNPLSIALGTRARLLGLDVYAAAEWFASVDLYDVLETEDFLSQVPSQATAVPITQSRQSVINVGAGLSWQAASFFSFFGSVRSDNSYREPASDSFIGLDPFDILHWTGGVGIFSSALDVWVGAVHSTGKARARLSPSPLPGAPDLDASTSFKQIGFVLAFNAVL